MIELAQHEYQILRDLQRAGAAGLTLRETRLSTAIRLQLAGVARISSGAPQRVTITQQGAAFLRRTVWA